MWEKKERLRTKNGWVGQCVCVCVCVRCNYKCQKYCDTREPVDPLLDTPDDLIGKLTTKHKHMYCMLPLVGPLRDPMACCSSDRLSLRTTSARADFSSCISSSCIWTLCSREAMRSVTSILLAADALSSEETQRAGVRDVENVSRRPH